MSNPSDDDLPGMLALAKGIAEQRWPHTMDAREWAKKWVEQIKLTPDIVRDEGTMIAWFANAIMAGYDTGQRRMWEAAQERKPDSLELALAHKVCNSKAGHLSAPEKVRLHVAEALKRNERWVRRDIKKEGAERLRGKPGDCNCLGIRHEEGCPLWLTPT